jgi:hypothetical protein
LHGNGLLMDEFFNPKSLITPTAAGVFTMLATNTLVSQFGLPGNYTAFIISSTVGLVLLAITRRLKTWQRFVYFLLNTLVIFTVAIGINETAIAAINRAHTSAIVQTSESPRERPFVSDWFTKDTLRYVEEWLNHQLGDDEFRDLLLGAKDLSEMKRLTREGKQQIAHDRFVQRFWRTFVPLAALVIVGGLLLLYITRGTENKLLAWIRHLRSRE